jgi:hypothetical protein
MPVLRNDTICARRRFNPLSRCTVALAFKPAPAKPRYRGKNRVRRYTRRKAAPPVVARV